MKSVMTRPDNWHVKYNVILRHITNLSFESPYFESIFQIPHQYLHVDKTKPCWSQNISWDKLHTMFLLPELEDGTYTQTGRTLYKNQKFFVFKVFVTIQINYLKQVLFLLDQLKKKRKKRKKTTDDILKWYGSIITFSKY